jgi:hypothetical protein
MLYTNIAARLTHRLAQDEVLAVTNAELQQALATATAKVGLIVTVVDLL